MTQFKRQLSAVTNEEIERASVLWQCGEPFKVIAYKVGWTETLFWRIAKLCREFDKPGEEHFPVRNRRPFKAMVKEHGDKEAVEAAKKPVPITQDVWKAALSSSDCKPSTVKSRRPGDYLVRRKLVDPTLSLPSRRV
jgi:hypothetical protein